MLRGHRRAHHPPPQHRPPQHRPPGGRNILAPPRDSRRSGAHAPVVTPNSIGLAQSIPANEASIRRYYRKYRRQRYAPDRHKERTVRDIDYALDALTLSIRALELRFWTAKREYNDYNIVRIGEWTTMRQETENLYKKPTSWKIACLQIRTPSIRTRYT